MSAEKKDRYLTATHELVDHLRVDPYATEVSVWNTATETVDIFKHDNSFVSDFIIVFVISDINDQIFVVDKMLSCPLPIVPCLDAISAPVCSSNG